MPLYMLQCCNGHEQLQYAHTAQDRYCETRVCACGATMAHVYSTGRINRFFSEKSPQVIENLGPEPVTITSYKQHEAIMRQAGRAWAGPPKRGLPGCWT